jgi:hypothetical protein
MKKDFKNKTVYFRESYNEDHPFTIISNHLVKDERLSATEKGLMLMILSNKNIYILNSTYLQKESNLGKVHFNKSLKKLQELGYLLKKPLKNGGYKWIVMESTMIFDELQKFEYIKYDLERSTWIINEDLESSLQLSDFHRKSENQNAEYQKPKSENPINGNSESQNLDTKPIISTNNINSKIGIINNEENTEGIRNNETLEGKIHVSGSTINSKLINVDRENEFESHIQNSLPILLKHGESLRNMLKGHSLTLNDFTNYSDAYIAHIILSINLEKIDVIWAENKKDLKFDNKLYAGLVYACRTALDLEIETKLKAELLFQSKMSLQELHKHIFG